MAITELQAAESLEKWATALGEGEHVHLAPSCREELLLGAAALRGGLLAEIGLGLIAAKNLALMRRLTEALERIAPAAPLVSDGKEFPGTPTILEGYLARIVMALEHGNDVAYHTVK